MRLNKRIGPNPENPSEPYINSANFADELNYHHKMGKEVQVRINSVGGSVLQGWDIVDAIGLAGAGTHCYGLAASMAGICLAAGKVGKRTADAHSTSMLHGPHTVDGSESPMVDMIRNGFTSLLTASTKMHGEKIKGIMDKGDHYFDASDMLAAGLIDAIVPSTENFLKPVNASVSQLQEIYNSLETKPTMEGNSIFAKIFGKKTEDEGIDAALEMKSEIVALKTKEGELNAKIASLEAAKTVLENQIAYDKTQGIEAKAKALIEKGVSDKKLVFVDDAAKTKMIAAAVASFETVETMLKAMPVGKGISAAATIEKEGGLKESATSYEALMKHNPEKLQAIAENDPELFERLSDEYIESKKNKSAK